VTRSWLTVPEAAERLGLGVTAVYDLLRQRRLGCRRVGPNRGRYQITEEHVRAYLESCEVAPREEPAREAAPPAAPRAKVKPGLRFDGQPYCYEWGSRASAPGGPSRPPRGGGRSAGGASSKPG
jgi:excisionase family DNA binding protein